MFQYRRALRWAEKAETEAIERRVLEMERARIRR